LVDESQIADRHGMTKNVLMHQSHGLVRFQALERGRPARRPPREG
jgi:hypothetical protein